LGILLLEGFLRLGGVVYNEYQESGQAKAESENSFKVLALGESTTAGLSNWPNKAQDILNNRHDKIDFVFINKAINSTESGVLLSKVEEQVKKYEPDAVISMMGMNDGDFHSYFSNFKYKGEAEKSFFDKILSFLEENIRVYKFIKLVQGSDSFKEQSEWFQKDVKNTNYYLRSFAPDGNREKGIKKCRKILRDEPNNEEVWSILGWLTYIEEERERTVKEAKKYFEKALDINPEYKNAYYGLIGLNLYDPDVEKSISIAKKALEYYPNNEFFYSFLLKNLSSPSYNNAVDFSERERVIRKQLGKNFVYSEDSPKDVTAHHYNKLYEILKKYDIPLIAMQYPTKDVQELKNYFSKERQKDIIFVSNEENFEKALQENDYEDIFNDRCYDDFGHATEKGRMITAQNVASTIESNFDFDQ
jgi:tetratricopeptide (TPR) repeat protein